MRENRAEDAQDSRADDDAAEHRRKINHIRNRRRTVIGTVAEHYLRFRGLNIDANHLDYMGFDQEAGWREVPDDPASPILHVPCLITGFRPIEGAGDEIVAIQKTRLHSDGSKWLDANGKTARRFNGSPKGAVIKIDPDETVTTGLLVGEGLETCLSARTLGFRPVWAAGTAGAIETFPVVDGIECLTLLTERGDNGANARAVEACANRWQRAGKGALYADPPPDCDDVNDILQKRMARA